MSRERAWARRCSWPSTLLACVLLAAAGCGGSEAGGTEAPPDTFHAMFSNGAGTNANTSALDLTFDPSGSNNGTVTASAV